MRRPILGLAISIFASLAIPIGSEANFLDCRTVALIVGSGDSNPFRPRILAGELDTVAYSFGTVDTLGDLLCFTLDPRCECLRSIARPADAFGGITPESSAYRETLFDVLRACRDTPQSSRSFSGMAQEAALAVCR